MKSINQIKELFLKFQSDLKLKWQDYLSGENWQIVMFKPYIQDNKMNYEFRIYGKVSGSKYPQYNNNPQYLASVTYNHYPNSKEFNRRIFYNQLNPIIEYHINLEELIEKI